MGVPFGALTLTIGEGMKLVIPEFKVPANEEELKSTCLSISNVLTKFWIGVKWTLIFGMIGVINFGAYILHPITGVILSLLIIWILTSIYGGKWDEKPKTYPPIKGVKKTTKLPPRPPGRRVVKKCR